MSHFEDPRDYKILLLFTDGNKVSHQNLAHCAKGDISLIERLTNNGFITKAGEDDDGVSLYRITRTGRDYRDRRGE